jgi:hypothetical protein
MPRLIRIARRGVLEILGLRERALPIRDAIPRRDFSRYVGAETKRIHVAALLPLCIHLLHLVAALLPIPSWERKQSGNALEFSHGLTR